MNDILIKDLKENGIVKIENFLNYEELFQIKEIVKYYSASKNSRNSFWPVKIHQLISKLLVFKFEKFRQSLKLLKVNKNKKLYSIADAYFLKKSYLNHIDAYHSKVSQNPVIPWHTDQAYHGDLNPEIFVDPEKYFLKIFIYLTDVEPDNGCMAYIPKSHQLGYAIRKGIFEKKIKYSPYWHLKDFRNILKKQDNKNFFQSFFRSTDLINNFLKETEFCENNLDTNKFDYTLKAGSAIIFDEGGIHRGAKILREERLVIRYFFSKFKN